MQQLPLIFIHRYRLILSSLSLSLASSMNVLSIRSHSQLHFDSAWASLFHSQTHSQLNKNEIKLICNMCYGSLCCCVYATLAKWIVCAFLLRHCVLLDWIIIFDNKTCCNVAKQRRIHFKFHFNWWFSALTMWFVAQLIISLY